MMRRTGWYVALALLVAPVAAQQRNVEAPRFEVDPLWPMPLPNHRVLAFFETKTLRSGSVWDMELSRDRSDVPLLADGVNEELRILRRDTLEVLTAFGDGGRQPGQFFGVHNIAVDSRGNIYTTETYTGARVQRFLYKGVGSVPRSQGVPWPKR